MAGTEEASSVSVVACAFYGEDRDDRTDGKGSILGRKGGRCLLRQQVMKTFERIDMDRDLVSWFVMGNQI